MTDIAKVNPKIRILFIEVLSTLYGINYSETESPDGWFETSAGAEFGQEILNQVIEAFQRWDE